MTSRFLVYTPRGMVAIFILLLLGVLLTPLTTQALTGEDIHTVKGRDWLRCSRAFICRGKSKTERSCDSQRGNWEPKCPAPLPVQTVGRNPGWTGSFGITPDCA
jgi:hypothetical protein